MADLSLSSEGLYRRRGDSKFPKGPGDPSQINGAQGERLEGERDCEVKEDLETDVFQADLLESYDLTRGSNVWVMAAEVVYGYLWWSVFQSLPAVLWFYPLCLMHISGFEILAIFWLSPALMGVRFFRKFVTSPFGVMLVRALTMMGVASFQAPSTLSRLMVLSLGNFFAMLALAGSLWDKSRLDRHRHIYLHMLGYLLFLAVRVWGSSFNYIFVDYTLNTIALIIGITLSYFLYLNDFRPPLLPSPTPPCSPKKSPMTFCPPGLVFTAVAFGALIYLTMLLFGEVSVITRWAVAPYPDHGPSPNPWGMATMVAFTVGVVVFGHQTDLLSSWAWPGLGLIFSMILYFTSTYMAFFGGFILAIYTASLWPFITKCVVRYPPHWVFPIAMVVMFFFILLSVWVVAYNFVPGGVFTRERTDVLLVLLVLSCGLGTCNISFPQADVKAPENPPKYKVAVDKVSFFGHVFRRLSTITEDPELEEEEPSSFMEQVMVQQMITSEDRETKLFHRKILKGSLIILLLALLGFIWRYQAPIPIPQKERPNVFSAGIWAFHFGYDNKGWPSMERAARLIENSELDVIGLLETDAARPFIGNHDLASWLSERLQMYTDYGPGTHEHTWGTMLMSKYPIVKSEHYMLPSPEGEIAPAIMATLNISGHLIDFFVVHFGNDVDDLDRKLQGQRTAEILDNSTLPVVMLSYITSKPGSRDYERIIHHGRVKDIDPSDRKRWCEYIFYRDVIKLGYARISHGGLSDTEVQIGKFLIPTTPHTADHLNLIHDPTLVPQWQHFPAMFGERHHGHFADHSRHNFHMNTPKYFTQD